MQDEYHRISDGLEFEVSGMQDSGCKLMAHLDKRELELQNYRKVQGETRRNYCFKLAIGLHSGEVIVSHLFRRSVLRV